MLTRIKWKKLHVKGDLFSHFDFCVAEEEHERLVRRASYFKATLGDKNYYDPYSEDDKSA